VFIGAVIGLSIVALAGSGDTDPGILPSVPKQALAEAEMSLRQPSAQEVQGAASKAAIGTAVANQFHGAKVNEMALLHVDDATKRPEIHGPMWVVALDPALGDALNRDPRTGAQLTSKPQFFLAFFDAKTGEFRYATSFSK